MSARNPLIVRADICGFSARSSAEKVKFSVSCTVYIYIHFQIKLIELCLLLLYFNPIVPKQYGV